MSSTIDLCPYLGLNDDSSVRLSYADGRHRCYALSGDSTYIPDSDHQLRYCLASGHTGCPRYRQRQAGQETAGQAPREQPARRRRSLLRPILWVSLAVVALVVGWRLVAILADTGLPAQPAAPAAPTQTATPAQAEAPAFPTPDPQFTPAGGEATATPAAALIAQRRIEEIPTPTLAPGEVFLAVTPQAEGVGWVTSGEARGNHLGDSYLYTGIYDDELYHGVMQFDLSRVPRGAPIHAASLILTGLEDDRLDPTSETGWQLRWLDPSINEDWARMTFQLVHNADVSQTILPVVSTAELAPYAVNQFVFDAAQLSLLQQAILDEQNQLVMRLDGPETGAGNVFAWDTGYGPASRGNSPVLRLVMGPAPATPPPVPTREYVVVTSTPTPVNVLTAAAVRRTEVAISLRIGTATPTPRSMVTATATPENEETAQAERLLAGLPFVVTATPRPVNNVTATANAVYATAVAITTGTFTPLPTDYVTATPTTPFVVVTNTPTAADIFTWLSQAIAEATRTATAGPPTPFPPGVVTATAAPTETAVPLNAETAQAQVILVTIQALTTGTWTPTPTATQTPTATPTASSTSEVQQPAPTTAIAATTTLTETEVAEPTAAAIQPAAGSSGAAAAGRLLFVSDRLGEPRFFSLDTQCITRSGGCSEADVLPLDDAAFYEQARDNSTFAPNGYGRVIVQLDDRETPQIYLQDFIYDTIKQVTTFTGASYDATWSPVGSQILFVSNEPGNDDLFTISVDGTNANRLTGTPAWEKHPTWSPNGAQIVFFTNRDGRNQLWIMNADGSNQRILLNSAYNDWDPVWVR
ncbi:MAG: TolB family protein [Anaerolineales bacterium]|nr:TolB family protein [Anaerolineales bacterium]